MEGYIGYYLSELQPASALWLRMMAIQCVLLWCIVGGVHSQMYHRFQTFRTWQPPDYSPMPEDGYPPRAPHPNQWHPPRGYRPPGPGPQSPTPSTPIPATPGTCSPETCRIPECHCPSLEAPIDKANIPQIVMFTFDDAVNEQVIDYYKQLFPAERVNPNGCPISATFFVSHNWTDYTMVKELYLAGHEIASHSVTHRMPQSWWMHASYDTLKRELAGQRDNIVQKAAIPKREVRGVRVPFLQIGGDTQFQMMADEGFQYDASFMTGPYPEGGMWPYTLDVPPQVPTHCSNMNCPKQAYPGMWEVPLNRWTGPSGHPCAMVDSCNTQPSGKGEALSYLWQNFNKQYYGNKAPVGVNMHAVWFQTATYLEAMQEFIQTLVEMDDVYIVTVHQTLEWMREPRKLDALEEWEPWLSSCQGRAKKKLVKMVPRPGDKPEGDKADPMKPDAQAETDDASDPMKARGEGGRERPSETPSKDDNETDNDDDAKENRRGGGNMGKERGSGGGGDGERILRGRTRGGRLGMTDEQGSKGPHSSAPSSLSHTPITLLALLLASLM